MNKGGTAFIHHLRLFLWVEILRDEADDANELTLPILKPRCPLLDQVEEILFREPELTLDLLDPRLSRVMILFVLSGTRDRTPQIVVGRLGVRPPLLGAPPFLSEVGLGAMGVAIDAVVLQRVSGVQHPLDCFGSVPLLAFLDIVACETEIVEDPVRIGPLSKQIIVLE